jgi:hypothetical protein
MLEVLQFIFYDFWHWLGFTLILIVCINPLTRLIEVKYGSRDGEDDK